MSPAPYRTERERRVLLKVDRAKQHISELNSVWLQFLSTNPYEVVREVDEDVGRFTDSLRVHGEPPLERIALVTGDVAHNLRSALDHLIWQLIETNNGTPGDRSEFPIFKNSGAYKSGVSGKVKGVSKDARRILDRLKPYDDGTGSLWTLHRLDIYDKHKLLIVIAMQMPHITLDFGAHMAHLFPDIGAAFSMPIGIVAEDRRVYNGAELFTGDFPSHVHMEPRYLIAPEFGPGQPGDGMQVGEVLYKLCYLVQRIVRILGRHLRD